jgi:hypothetical protein
MNHRNFDPSAHRFNPNGDPNNRPSGSSTPRQMSAPQSPYLEARVLNLEEEHADLRGQVDNLKDLYHDLRNSFGRQDRQHNCAKSLQDTDAASSRQIAMQFKQELERLSREVRESANGDTDEQKATDRDTPKLNGDTIPHSKASIATSHGSGAKSLAPHLRVSKRLGATNSSV